MNMPYPPLQTINPLKALQQEYAILEINGKFGLVRLSDLIWVKGMKNAPSLRIYSGTDATIALRRSLENIASADKVKDTINDFWNSPNTHEFKRVAFSPSKQPPEVLNLWVGYTITPSKGSWTTIKNYLFYGISNGDNTAYKYLICYLAHLLQKPEEKPGIMIVLLGGQGTGKGTLEIIIRKMFEATTLLVSDVDSVIGRFNAVLERAYVVFMDEALFFGDKKSTERLKSYVTSQNVQIEEKHQPERSIESFHRFFAASNSTTHFAQTDYDDRRMMYFKVSDAYKGKIEYWTNLYRAIDGGEVEALADYLINLDISDFVITERPQSEELLSQKIQSLQPFQKFWFDCLWRGETMDVGLSSEIPYDWSIGHFWATRSILEAFNFKLKGNTKYTHLTYKDIAEILKTVCPSATNGRTMISSKRSWGYTLPAIEIARQEFENYLGGKVNWPS